MTLLTIVLFILGLVALVGGAELLVRGASRLSLLFGISPLVVGLTVVAFGTSAPELAVSVMSALSGQADITVGNVIGSNICNTLLILGLSAVITPLVVSQQLIRIDVPIMVGTSLVAYFFAFDGAYGRLDGLILFSSVVIYTIWAIRRSRRETPEVGEEYAQEFGLDPEVKKGGGTVVKQISLMIVGLTLLVLGSRWMVDGAITFARAFGVSELVIGLTIVSLGTSLPEVATSALASIRGERDIAVGNVVGSNLFNILSVLGMTALVAPNGVTVSPSALHFDLPIMVATAVACLPVFFVGYQISRGEGALFLGFYVAYILFLVLAATHHHFLPFFSETMLYFFLPLTTLGLTISAWRFWRRDSENER